MCDYCRGHIMPECWILKRKEEQRNQVFSAFTVRKSPYKPFRNFKGKSSESEVVMDEYRPFISKEFMSLDSDNINIQLIIILRDTGASHSLLLEGFLPMC